MLTFSLSSLMGGDPGISQTVQKIQQSVTYALHEPRQVIRQRAEALLRQYQAPERNDNLEIRSIFDWVKSHYHYVHDPRGIEYVKSPEVSDQEISDYGKFMGDCDDVSAYLAALFKSIGYQVQLVVMTDIRSKDNDFQHIYAQIYSPQLKKWIPLDGTAKAKPFGWSAPAKRVKVYDV